MAYYSPRGQEAVAAAMGAALAPTDYLVTTYRGLHDQIAKGVPLPVLLAEMLGRAAGTGKGKGGPMHVVWPDVGLMLTTGVVGSGLPIAAGLAWAAQRGAAGGEPGRVTVVCFGDGATNIGAFHEAANLAALWQLPVVLLCQNNGYGEHTAFADHQRIEHVADRAAAYGMPGVTVDGNDPEAVLGALRDATARARAGGGPTLVEAVTYRLFGHVFGDRMSYVDPAELEAAWQRGARGALPGRARFDAACSTSTPLLPARRPRGARRHRTGRGHGPRRAGRGRAADRRGGTRGAPRSAKPAGRRPRRRPGAGPAQRAGRHHAGARRGAGVGPAGGAARRGHLRHRRVRRDQGPGRRARPRPGARHAHLRAGHRGCGRRCRARRAASRGRDHVHGLPRHLPRPARQPRGEAPVHVGGADDGPHGAAHGGGRGPAGGRPALADARVVADARAGIEGRGAEQSRRRPRPAGGVHRGRGPVCVHRAGPAAVAQGPRRRRECGPRCGRVKRAPATTSPS